MTYKSPNPHADNQSANFTSNMNLKLYKQPLQCNKQQCVEVKQILSSLEMFVRFQSLCSTAKKLLHPDRPKRPLFVPQGRDLDPDRS